jgi:hypothetical protein
MDWTPKGTTLDPHFLGNLEPDQVLVEFEGPRSFLARDPVGQLLFAHQCGESDDAWRYAVVPFTDDLAELLTNGRIDLWSALSQPRLWLVDMAANGEVLRCVAASLDEIPSEYRPQHGVTLHSEHEPLLSIRALGTNVELGQATLGLLRDQLDSARTGLRLLAEAALGVSKSKGQPAKAIRRYYDLPALLLAGSIQVSIYPPADRQKTLFAFDDVWTQMQSLLDAGLRHIDGDLSALETLNKDDTEAILRAVYSFAPPARGNVTETEVSGRLISRPTGVVRMGRNVRGQLSQRLHAVLDRTPQLFEREGFINELDLEEGTCLLRDESGATVSKLRFAHDLPSSELLFEDVKRVFDNGDWVKIVAFGFSLDEEVLLVSVKEAPAPEEG